MTRWLIASAALLLSSVSLGYDFAKLADQHVVPAYQHLLLANQALAKQATAFCEQPEDAGLRALRNAYIEAFLAWQGAQHLRFGPVQYLSREHRLEFWPDKRGTVAKQVRALLAGDELQRPDLELHSKSVALQGYSALEYLLYQPEMPAATSCPLILAISENLQSIAQGLLKDWSEGENAYRALLVAPGPGNLVFGSDDELADTLLNSLHTQLEFMVGQKLGRPLGETPEQGRGRRAEAWRSGSALAALQKNLQATREFYQLTFATQLKDEGLARRIDEAFTATTQQLNQLEPPLHQKVEQAQGWQALHQAQSALNALRELIGSDLAQSLSLSLGFNALDGD